MCEGPKAMLPQSSPRAPSLHAGQPLPACLRERARCLAWLPSGKVLALCSRLSHPLGAASASSLLQGLSFSLQDISGKTSGLPANPSPGPAPQVHPGLQRVGRGGRGRPSLGRVEQGAWVCVQPGSRTDRWPLTSQLGAAEVKAPSLTAWQWASFLHLSVSLFPCLYNEDNCLSQSSFEG